MKWYVDGFYLGNTTVGIITTNGLYTAPATEGTHNVVAVSEADPSKSGTAVVTVKISVSISPISATVAINGTQQFNANVIGTANKAVTWSVDGIPGGNSAIGTVSATGFYTAPTTSGMHSVTATSQADPAASASATVFVTSGYCLPAGAVCPVRKLRCCPGLICVGVGAGQVCE